VAAPFFLQKEGHLTRRAVALCTATALLVLAAGVASIYPPAPGVEGWMPVAFFVLLAGGTAVVAATGGFRRRARETTKSCMRPGSH